MTRLASALRLELTLQVRQRFLHAALFSGLIWLAVLLPLSRSLRPVVEPYILLGDTCIIGFFFVARHGVLREAGTHPRRGHLDAVAILGVPGRETDFRWC